MIKKNTELHSNTDISDDWGSMLVALSDVTETNYYRSTFNYEFEHAFITKTIQMMGFIGVNHPNYAAKAVAGLYRISSLYTFGGVQWDIIDQMGQICQRTEACCNRVIEYIHRIISTTWTQDIADIALSVLTMIEQQWAPKKHMFTPLLYILGHGNTDQKLRVITLFSRQLEGYWEKPIQSIKHIVTGDDSIQLRRAAAMCLGDIGACQGQSVREAIFECEETLVQKINKIKKEINKKSMDNFSLKFQLQDSTTILNLIRFYIKKYSFH